MLIKYHQTNKTYSVRGTKLDEHKVLLEETKEYAYEFSRTIKQEATLLKKCLNLIE